MTRITDTLRGEHGPLLALLAHCETAATKWELADLLLAGRTLEAALLSHAEIENELLFGALEAKVGCGGPTAAMRAEHDEIDAGLSSLGVAADEAEARRILLRVVHEARDHFAKEEQVLFPMAEQILGDEELERQATAWAVRRGVALPAREASFH